MFNAEKLLGKILQETLTGGTKSKKRSKRHIIPPQPVNPVIPG